MLRSLAGGEGIPHAVAFGQQSQRDVMALELLGPSLHELFEDCGRKLSVKTVAALGVQLVTRLEYLYSKGVVHRDIQPKSILMGRFKPDTAYLIDFGIAEEFSRLEQTEDREYIGGPFLGTNMFSCIAAHRGYGMCPPIPV